MPEELEKKQKTFHAMLEELDKVLPEMYKTITFTFSNRSKNVEIDLYISEFPSGKHFFKFKSIKRMEEFVDLVVLELREVDTTVLIDACERVEKALREQVKGEEESSE